MPLILAGATSGSATLQATDAQTVTMTLPATSGTLVTTGGAQTIEFADGSASAPSITNSGDTNTGIFFPAADTIAFTEGGVESMRIDSSGNLGLGKAPEAQAGFTIFDIGAGATSGLIDLRQNGNRQLRIFNSSTNSFLSNAADGGSIVFQTTSGAIAERMRINSSGAVILAGGSTSATGVGITFPATQSASSDANTLDDYEEGTWTPTVSGGTTAGTTTYNVQNGTYTKIGRVVTATFKVGYTAATGTGTLSVANFPFTAASGEHVGSVMVDNLDMPSAGSYALYLNATQTQAQIYTSIDNGAVNAAQVSNESATIWATITYFT